MISLHAVVRASRDCGCAVWGSNRPGLQVLLAAIVHSDESVRADCLELVATNPKQAEAPARLEVQVAARWLACCLRATSPGLRNRCIALVHKLMARLQTAAAACVHRCGRVSSLGRPSSRSSSVLEALERRCQKTWRVARRAGNLSAGATGGRFAGALRGRATVPVLGLVRDADAADAGEARRWTLRYPHRCLARVEQHPAAPHVCLMVCAPCCAQVHLWTALRRRAAPTPPRWRWCRAFASGPAPP